MAKSPKKKAKSPSPKKKQEYTGQYVDPCSIPRDDPNELLEHLQAKMGGDGVVLQRGEDVEGRLDLRRPSGITTLDIACGGGLPAGGLSQIDGSDGIGKNLLINHYFAKNQLIYGSKSNLQMVCLEFNYDKLFGRACGVKVALSPYEIKAEARRRALSGEPEMTSAEYDEFREQTGNFHIFRGAAAEKILEATVNSIQINSYQVIGIDSWDAMLTIAEDSKDLEDNAKVADASNIQTRWMRKVFGALSPQKICPECFDRPLGFKRHGEETFSYECPNADCGWKGRRPFMWENETTVIGIRQIRANLNKTSMRQKDWKVGGAHALRHGKMIDIQLRRGETITLKDGTKIGKEIMWELTKGKAGTHEGKTGMYTYYFSPPEIDVATDMINYCTANKLISYGGPKNGYSFQDMNYREGVPLKLGTKEAMQSCVEDDRELQNALRLAMMRHAGLGYVRYK